MNEQEQFKAGMRVRFSLTASFMHNDKAQTLKHVYQMSGETGIIRRANDVTRVAMVDFYLRPGLNCGYDELEPAPDYEISKGVMESITISDQYDADLEPAYKAALWALNRQPGDEPAEQTARRIQDGGDAQSDDTLLMRLDALKAENTAQEQRITELEERKQSTDTILLNHAHVLQDILAPHAVVGDDMEQAVSRVLARVRALESENAALRAALEPFAVIGRILSKPTIHPSYLKHDRPIYSLNDAEILRSDFTRAAEVCAHTGE